MASRAAWAAHFGLARTPFGKAIAAKDLFARQAHAQATARISFCIGEALLGVITGDVGAGKTVAVEGVVHPKLDLIDAMVASANEAVSDEQLETIERSACPTCGSCSGMFTANSMNCLT